MTREEALEAVQEAMEAYGVVFDSEDDHLSALQGFENVSELIEMDLSGGDGEFPDGWDGEGKTVGSLIDLVERRAA